MKRTPPSLQFLAAAASPDAATTIMSSRPPYRGSSRNQWRRGFSYRPSGDGAEHNFVTGDSHFRSVRDTNRGFRQSGYPGNFSNNSSYRPPFNPRAPPFHPRTPSANFRQAISSPSPQPLHQDQQFRPVQPLPFDQNQQFRPPQPFRPMPPKPLDYRNWEYAKAGPPPHCERFTVLSYNILADYLAIDHRSKLYSHIPHHILDWEWRKRNIIFELGLWSSDILCFQEVDRFQDLEGELKLRGYAGIWKMRTGDPVDGCAIFWRVSRFKLMHEEFIEFNKLGLRDNVAQICVLESMNQNNNNDASALQTSSSGSNKVVICNIHVLYNPKRGEIKLGQIRVLLEKAHAVSRLWDASVVICGDFNCTPKSPLYNFISEQKLNLLDIPRDKVSGQASAEIRRPRPFVPNVRAPIDILVRTPVLDERVGQSAFPLDIQKQNGQNGNSKDIPFVSNLSQPECVDTALDVASGSSINKQLENENRELSHRSEGKTLGAEAGFRNMTELPLSVPDTSSMRNLNGSHNEDGFSSCPIGDRIHEFASLDSHDVHISPNEVEIRCREDICATSEASWGSFSKHSQTNLDTENEGLCREKAKLSSVHDSSFSNDTILPEPTIASNTDVSLSEMLKESSVSHRPVVPPHGSLGNLSSAPVGTNKENPSTSYEVDDLCKSTSIDIVLDEKMENLSVDELVEVTNEDEALGEDSMSFLSDLHNTDGGFPSDLSQFSTSDSLEHDEYCEKNIAALHCQQLNTPSDEILDGSPDMDSEPVDADRIAYDPSAWTPMEIETATGSSECTLMEHPIKLRSTYSEVEDCSGARDSSGEPLVTSYHRCFLGTVDYIWRSEGLQTVRVLAPIPKHAMQWTRGFPTKKWGSDHVALVSELAFIKDVTPRDTEVQ